MQDILTKFGTNQEETPSLSAAGPYPAIVLSGLALFGLATVLTRTRVPAAAAPDRLQSGWRPIALVTVGVVLDLLLAERAGFVIASAVLFWFVARAFDPRHPVRDALFATVVSVGAYLLFGRALDLQLPAGCWRVGCDVVTAEADATSEWRTARRRQDLHRSRITNTGSP